MKPIPCLSLMAFGFVFLSNVVASEKISLSLVPGLSRADIYIEPYKGEARGILILCPGNNGNGGDLIDSAKWGDFAKNESLDLVGISFASDNVPPGQSYFNVSNGSGQILLDGLKRAFGPKQLPLLVYGFSRGAQFTYSFARWKPDLVMAWCAYSATEWEVPEAILHEPRGIIACGEEDETNYSFSMLQFLKGRSMSKPWTWVSLAHTGHVWSPLLDDFVRAYFASILVQPQERGLWLDVETKTSIGANDLKEHPTLAAWLPDEKVASAWKGVHEP